MTDDLEIVKSSGPEKMPLVPLPRLFTITGYGFLRPYRLEPAMPHNAAPLKFNLNRPPHRIAPCGRMLVIPAR